MASGIRNSRHDGAGNIHSVGCSLVLACRCARVWCRLRMLCGRMGQPLVWLCTPHCEYVPKSLVAISIVLTRYTELCICRGRPCVVYLNLRCPDALTRDRKHPVHTCIDCIANKALPIGIVSIKVATPARDRVFRGRRTVREDDRLRGLMLCSGFGGCCFWLAVGSQTS